MKQVYDNLYVGDVNDADNQNKIDDNDIQYILNFSGSGPGRDSAPSYQTIKENNYFHIPIADDGTNPDFLIQTILETAKEIYRKAREEDCSMLVHCAIGSSRSVAVAAALMSFENKKRVEENVNRIKKVRPVANPEPNLLKQVSRITSEVYNQ